MGAAIGIAEKALGQPALKAKWVMTSRGLRLREAVIHRPVEVAAKLRDLAGSNQGADRDQTRTSRDVRFRAALGDKRTSTWLPRFMSTRPTNTNPRSA